MISKHLNVFAHLKPLVDTLGVELVIAGQDPEELARLEVTHAHHTPGRQSKVGTI